MPSSADVTEVVETEKLQFDPYIYDFSLFRPIPEVGSCLKIIILLEITSFLNYYQASPDSALARAQQRAVGLCAKKIPTDLEGFAILWSCLLVYRILQSRE